MRLLLLEIKRILKTRTTVILLFSSLFLAFLMAYIPTTFSFHEYTDAEGNKVKLTGLASIEYEKRMQADLAGTVTPDKVRQAVERYQACLTKYGVTNSYDLPEGVYEEEIMPYAPLLHGVREIFADPATGIAPSIMEIDPERIDDFYGQCERRNTSLLEQEQREHPAAQALAREMYREVEKPFWFFPGYGSNPMDYQVIIAFLVLLFCTVITAPVFTSDYQTGADDILRCTKHGRTKLAGIKILSALLICTVTFSLCTLIYITVSDSLFGWECTKTSMQMIYSVVNLPDMNIGQLQCFLAVSGLLCTAAAVSFTLFLSSKFKNMVVSLSVALLFCILPIIVYIALPTAVGNWVYPVIPASGVGLQTSILYAVIDFDFWNVGKHAVWLPHVMLGAYIIEIPMFIVLTIRSYSRHNAN